MSLTPDLVEWLLADKKVCQRWKNLARRLQLGDHIPVIERRHRSDSGQLRKVIRLWQELFPDTFTVRGCKNVLAAEGLHHMWLWLNLMTQNTGITEPGIQHSSPWSGYLYNQPLPRTSRAHSYTSDYYSNTTTPDPSRPSSRQSDQDYSQYSRPSSQQSDNFMYKTAPSNQTSSCPSTPQNHRRSIDVFPGCVTKPGAIPPAKSFHPQAAAPSNTIYSLLYKPDLIKLSSPRIVRKATRRSDILNKKNNTTVLKRQHTTSLSELESFQTENTSNRVKIDIANKTDHEKEILKLCDEILVEINGKDFDTKNICTKNDKHPERITETRKQSQDVENKGVIENSDSVKVNIFNVHKVKTVQLVPINKESFKENKIDESINETYISNNKLGQNNVGNNGVAYDETSNKCENSDYFDHLVDIIDKALKDLST